MAAIASLALLVSSASAFNRWDLSDERIVNGIPTTASEYPFIVDIRFDVSGDASYDSYNESFCTGSLVQLEWPATILTAAHCLYYNDSSLAASLGVYLGRSDQDAPLSPTNDFTWHAVWKYVWHEDYNSTTIENDIGLMFLDEDLSNDGRLGVVTLDEDGDFTVDDPFQVIGYGANKSNGSATDTLEYTNVAYVTNTKCQNKLNSYFLGEYGTNFTNETIGDTMMCALGDNTDSCQGDSGGPLIINGTTTQVGVTSWGIGCNWGLPGVYAPVHKYVDWIEDQIEDASDDFNVTDDSDDSSETDGVKVSQMMVGLFAGILLAITQ